MTLFFEGAWRCFQEYAELLFIEALLVSFLGRDDALFEQFHDGIVERLVTLLLSDLHHAGDLVGLTFANEVRDWRIHHEHFESRDTSRFVDPFEEVLRNKLTWVKPARCENLFAL